MTLRKTLPLALLLCSLVSSPLRADPTPEEIEFFEKKIRPVLVENCYRCHAQDAKKVKGGLLLDSRAGLLKGGEGGIVVVPGQPEKSRLIEAIHYKNVDLQMPPRGKLPDAVIADLTAWVKMGAPWGDERAPRVNGGSDPTFDLAKRKREHWAWQAIENHKPPTVKNQTWPRSDIDRFILARLEDKGLSPAAAADPRTLVRRLYFDLIGLPPSSKEVETFLRENGNDHTLNQAAVAKLVDRLLDSPHFGERWGSTWSAMPSRAAMSSITRCPTPISTAITSSGPSIRMCLTTSSWPSTSPATCCPNRAGIPRRNSTNRFSVPASGFWASSSIRRSTSARTEPIARTT
jgi:Protein of unknown function (DUF1549)/Planctomycete cytochrome C